MSEQIKTKERVEIKKVLHASLIILKTSILKDKFLKKGQYKNIYSACLIKCFYKRLFTEEELFMWIRTI